MISGNAFQPDLNFNTKENVLYILDLTIGFETDMQINIERKAANDYTLHQTLLPNYNEFKVINLSLEALGNIGSSAESFTTLLYYSSPLHFLLSK